MKEKDHIEEIIHNSIEKKYPNLSEDEYQTKFQELFDTKKTNVIDLFNKYYNKDKRINLPKINRQRVKFEQRLNKRWLTPLRNLEYLIHRCICEGNDYNRKNNDFALDGNNFKHIALARLHGQACLIANEVLALLRSGYSEGANARWRSLYELSVISSILIKEDVNISQRYLEYYHILNHDEYRKYYDTLANPSDNDKKYMELLISKYEALIKIYGKEFGKKYGWLSSIIPNIKDRTIYSLQKYVDLENMNHLYSFANINVHAGPDSLFTKISMYNGRERNIILAGPSNYGLAEPGSHTASSITLVTSQFLLLTPNFDRIILVESIMRICETIQKEFEICQKTLEKDEEKLS